MPVCHINSQMTVLPGELPQFSQDQVKNEPMLFNCNANSAYQLGGPITQEFISLLPDEWKSVPLVIDSRVHMLMPGWYPCIPGWHHDDVPRTRADGQPNYAEGQDRSEHIIALVNGDICPTRFATGLATFSTPRSGVIYAAWHKRVEQLIERGQLTTQDAPSNRLIHFNDRTWHTGTKAVSNGWRFFIRASRYWDADGNVIARRNPRTNEVRRQVQVYLDDPHKGW